MSNPFSIQSPQTEHNNGTSSIGRRLYWSVLSLFILFSVFFIVFQQAREKEYKREMIDTRLQSFNQALYNELQHEGTVDAGTLHETTFEAFVNKHRPEYCRVTIITFDGKVVYDNERKDYANIVNHSNRKEITEALQQGHGTDISRSSSTLSGAFFYSATAFQAEKYIIRSALPYNDSLAKSLQADQHFIWITLLVIAVLSMVLYRFTHPLGKNISALKAFARRADANENLEPEDLAAFTNDELGEISEHIIKLYMRLQHTKEEQNRLKRELTQNIAHELKTPVAGIRGYLETILTHPDITDTMRQQFLERSYAQSQRLSSLLADISTLNRMDDAPDMMPFEDVDISVTVKQIASETALQFESHSMTFVNRLPDNIHLKGNPSMIYSIFRNLTDNALAYAGDGTTVTLSMERRKDRMHFTFSDNGVGIPTEHQKRIFERFYRVDKGRSRKMGGTGLGLAIVKNAVLLHGGSISVHNNSTGGACFEFTL
ncbi:MAG: sensor histidine kinase [Prevotella sp.]